jgi:PAS domain S-box-containing protein/putative nucleotidyltransferase with HDIG domain
VPEGIFIVSIDITEHKQAEKLQRTINRIANAVLTTGSLSELFPKIHKALEGILLFKSFYIALYDREEELISFPYFVDQYDEPPPPQKPGHGLTEYVLRTQKPLLATRNILDELVRKGEADLIGGDSNEWLGVPLILKGEVLGVMVVQTYEEEVHFSQRAVDILTYVSTQVANAIERKRTEEDLRAAEVRYRTLVEQIPAIVYIAGPQQYIGETYISPQIKQLGFTQEEWVADPDRWLKQLHPEDRERVLAEIEEMKEEQRSFQSEYRLFDREGQARWIHDETLHVKNQEGKPILLQGIMLDITDRKEAEERIKRQLEQLKTQRTIDMTILASTDLKLSLREILKQGLSQLQVDAIDILFLNTTTHFLEYKDGMGFHTKDIERTKLRVGEGYAGRAIRERKMVNVQDFNAIKFAFTRSELIAKEKFVSYWGMPLIVKGEVKGILEVFLRSRLQPDADWMNCFESLAGQTALAIDNATLFENLRRSNFELVRAYETTLEGWSSALDLRDKETEGHTKRVTTLTLQLAQTIGISDKELVHIRRGALLHDIGKMGVPDRILLKPDQLTDDEWEIMRQHPTYAKNLLSPIEYLRPSIDIPSSHHEKWDGTGYPMGLKGEQIPLAARIFAVTDVYDALTSDRPYRPAWTREKTLEQIKSLSGTHFDPKVVDAFLGLLK